MTRTVRYDRQTRNILLDNTRSTASVKRRPLPDGGTRRGLPNRWAAVRFPTHIAQAGASRGPTGSIQTTAAVAIGPRALAPPRGGRRFADARAGLRGCVRGCTGTRTLASFQGEHHMQRPPAAGAERRHADGGVPGDDGASRRTAGDRGRAVRAGPACRGCDRGGRFPRRHLDSWAVRVFPRRRAAVRRQDEIATSRGVRL